MSSMLALRPGATDLSSSRHHLGLGSCGASQGMLHRGSCSGKSFLDSGLPTPPATTAMTAVTAPNGRVAYPQQYGYQSEQRLPEMNQVDSRPSVYPSNGKILSGHYVTKTQHQNQPSTRNGQRQQEDQIAAHLQIPESVNNSKGSLSEFAAKITCLFWFETSSTLEYAEALYEGTMPNRGLNVDAIPTIGFTKWVTTILSTTQVGRNVVLLALMFIYRLKKFNPSVSGKRGSEFRLLTIALMLGNKFLDDNTYTNKTWAEVSGISVNEIHIMEVEFLSNMRYELYASADQWQDWKAKLNRFGSFYEKASKINNTSPTATSPTTPIRQSISHKLSSPPSGSKHKNSYATLPNPLHTAPYLPRSPAKQYQASEYPIDRKRSLDASLELPPAKRIHSTLPASSSLSPAVYTPQSAYTPDSGSSITPYDAARLPQLQMPTLPTPVSRNGSQLAPLGLPAPRAMSTVYPVTASHSHPVTPTTSGAPGMPSMANPLGVVVNSSSRVVSHTNSAHTSPTNLYGNSTPTRPGLSPSYFLMNRSSPYRPVRHVNTLLYPPPSAAMQTTSKNMDYQQMQYQPLSKNTSQLRPGPMPCLQPDAWAGHISTPVYRQY